jgi:hypothetical protein
MSSHNAPAKTHSGARRPEWPREAKALLAPEDGEGSRPNRANGSEKPISYALGRSSVGLGDRQSELSATRIADYQAAPRSADARVLEGADPHRHLQSLDLSTLDREHQTLLKMSLDVDGVVLVGVGAGCFDRLLRRFRGVGRVRSGRAKTRDLLNEFRCSGLVRPVQDCRCNGHNPFLE